MKIFFMLAYARKSPPKPLLADVVTGLERRGFDVVCGVAESFVVRPEAFRPEADLYVLKSHSAMWLSLASVLDAQGARILNPYPACVAAVNKIGSAHRLGAAGIPIPCSWVTGDLSRIAEVTDAMPLMVKPNVGRGGIGVRIVDRRDQLGGAQVADATLVQELVASVAPETKLYVVGERVFSVRKDPESGARAPCAPDTAVEGIARRCGAALGLGVYGVDVIHGQRGPVVVDVNHFPSFRGVPNAADVLADYIAGYARDEIVTLELPS